MVLWFLGRILFVLHLPRIACNPLVVLDKHGAEVFWCSRRPRRSSGTTVYLIWNSDHGILHVAFPNLTWAADSVVVP